MIWILPKYLYVYVCVCLTEKHIIKICIELLLYFNKITLNNMKKHMQLLKKKICNS